MGAVEGQQKLVESVDSADSDFGARGMTGESTETSTLVGFGLVQVSIAQFYVTHHPVQEVVPPPSVH